MWTWLWRRPLSACLCETNKPKSAAAFGSAAAARVLDQNLPHQVGADGQEMFTVLDFDLRSAFRAEDMPRAPVRHLAGGGPDVLFASNDAPLAEFVVDEGNYGAQSLVVTGMPVRQ